MYLSILQNVCAVGPACDGDWCQRGCNGKGNLMYSTPMYSAMKCGLLGCNVMANGFWPSPSQGWKIIGIPPPHGHYLKLSIEVMVPDIRRLMEKSESIFANHSRALPPQHRSKPQYEASRRSSNVLELNNLIYINQLQSKVCQCLKGEKETLFTRC